MKTRSSDNKLSNTDSLPETRRDLTMASATLPIITEITDDVTNTQLNESLQSLLSLVTQNNSAMTSVTSDIRTIKRDIETIKDVTNESEGIKEQLYTTQGRVSRVEMKHDKLEDQLLSLETNQYQKDLMFYNVEDKAIETELDLQKIVYGIIGDTMKVPLHHIFSRINPTGEIRLDSVMRMGKYRANNTRPIVATFLTKTGKNLVYSKPHIALLKNPIRIRISERFPTIIKERRQAQTKHLKALRDTYEEKTTKVTLKKDKIFVNGKERNTFAFHRNPLSNSTPSSINYHKLIHSEEIIEKESIFQAHSLHVQSKNQATAARNAIYQDPALCRATHIMYAYRIGNSGDNVESGFHDDDEVGGGSILMNLLESKNITNTFISVTRMKNGPNIGPSRFKHIENCAKELLVNVDESEPTFNYLQFNN